MTHLDIVDSARWFEQRLELALARVEELAHELARAHEELGSQRAQMGQLQDALAVVEGRTQRHESGQESARALHHETAALSERVEQEAALRRDLAAAVQRDERRRQEQHQGLRQKLEQLSARLEELSQQVASEHERERRVAQDFAEQGQREHTLDERMAALEAQLASDREALSRERESLARIAAALPGLLTGLDDLGERARSAQEERHRLDAAVAALRGERDRELELLELIEQQRSARQRTEERLTEADEALEELRRQLAAAAEERSMIGQQAAGNRSRLDELAEALEGQRLAIIEHFRRWTDAGVDSGRSQIEEIERANRLARDLLVRLSEGSDEAGHEQPL